MGRDATRAMGRGPILLLSYAGVLGGSERVLLDCATRLGRPALLACPEGPLAAAARDAGLPATLLAQRRPPGTPRGGRPPAPAGRPWGGGARHRGRGRRRGTPRPPSPPGRARPLG